MVAGRHHPEEQGLKQGIKPKPISIATWPVGIIQKNKD